MVVMKPDLIQKEDLSISTNVTLFLDVLSEFSWKKSVLNIKKN